MNQNKSSLPYSLISQLFFVVHYYDSDHKYPKSLLHCHKQFCISKCVVPLFPIVSIKKIYF